MATIDVKDAAGATVALEKPLTPARKSAALSRPVVLSDEDLAAIALIGTKLDTLDGRVDGLETLIGSTNTKLDTTITAITGNVAHGDADSGNASKIGAKAVTSISAQTLVAANGRTNLFSSTDGELITRPHAPLGDVIDGNASNTDGTLTSCIAASGDAAIFIHLTSIILTNMSATNIYVEIKCGTTVRATIPLPATSGAIFNPPMPLKASAANSAWNFDPSAAATTVYCTMIGFKSKVA